MADIATTKIFESDKIAVWEMVLEPGESTGVHTHYDDYMYYILEGSELEVTDKDGNVLSNIELNAGETSASGTKYLHIYTCSFPPARRWKNPHYALA